MTWIDWTIVAVPMVIVFVFALKMRQYTKSVVDFMAGGRVAGRYLVAVSDGMAATGLVSAVAQFEYMYQSGFAVGFWGVIGTPIYLLLTISGFVIFRFRETRALTLAQFLETRYSRRFRIFAGLLAAISGVINFAIFPAIASRFFVYFCGFPTQLSILGVPIPTFAILMAVFLSAAVLLVLTGGQLSIMVTDCVQGMFTYVMCLAIMIALLMLVPWSQVSESLQARPPGQSLIDPLDTYAMADFNIWFILIAIIGNAYSTMAWQGNAGANASPASPHEAKMAKIIGGWRTTTISVTFTLITVVAYTYLNHPSHAQDALAVQQQLNAIDNAAVQSQTRVPLAMSEILPIGIKGMFVAVMLALMLTTDTSYMHSWGSIIVQDVILPLRRRPLSTRGHLTALRISIVGVAIFAFLFSLLFNQTTYIMMFFALTGSIYLGGAGAVIIGGLYWKRGTTRGAWAAMFAGSGVTACAFAGEQFWPAIHGWLLGMFPNSEYLAANVHRFPINGQWMWLMAMVSAVTAYILVSLAGRKRFNLDSMLHRGAFADADHIVVAAPEMKKRTWLDYIGVDSNFTRADRWLTLLMTCWSMSFFVAAIVAVTWNVFDRWPKQWWANYFSITGVWVTLVVGAITSVWFTVGGVLDLRKLFKRLQNARRDPADDGRADSVPAAVPMDSAKTSR